MTMQFSSAGIRPAQQLRSARTRDAILKALETAQADGSLETLTVHDIVRLADCSIGAFYGRFDDKSAAIAGLYARRRTQFIDMFEGVNDHAASLEDWARAVSALALDHALENRALLAQAAGMSEPQATLFAASRVAEIGHVDQVAGLLRGRFGLGISAAECAGAATFALAMVGAMARDAAIHSSELLAASRTRDWFVNQIARAVIAYLRSF